MSEHTLIIGSGKTGTTGVLYAIEHSAPHKFNQLYEPRQIVDVRQAPEGSNIIAKVIMENFREKKQAEAAEILNHFDKKIIIKRDPRDRFISALLYYGRLSPNINKEGAFRMYNLLKKKQEDPKSVSVKELHDLYNEIGGLDIVPYFDDDIDYLLHFYQHLTDTHVNAYEDFVDDNHEGLSEYLGYPIEKAPDNNLGRRKLTIRSKKYDNWRVWFTDEDVEHFKSQPWITDYMSFFDYDNNDWELVDNPEISADESYKYFQWMVGLGVEKAGYGGQLSATSK